ncbi:hypothetical protein K0T92_03875 [Paenibacillus oenotherae]|uniref:Uncharacterized protein n=1 Tax=Paenibacillus oenotherae TaxID=1435645 RepID=A0ABS7D1S9_9BACL|nr:hypothetical protein [Paenibacillus oenotherae]MBW7473872.1 hypothetical protein [Paenibacillus oenotherae]
MWNIQDQILTASSKLEIEVNILTLEEREEIKNSIMFKFLEDNQLRKFPLFDKIKDYVGVEIADSWMWISDFINENTEVLFFKPDDEREYYRLNNGENLVSIIGELFNVEFYVTNPCADYLLGYNHSQCLIATGTASVWLENHQEYKKRYN